MNVKHFVPWGFVHELCNMENLKNVRNESSQILTAVLRFINYLLNNLNLVQKQTFPMTLWLKRFFNLNLRKRI